MISGFFSIIFSIFFIALVCGVGIGGMIFGIVKLVAFAIREIKGAVKGKEV